MPPPMQSAIWNYFEPDPQDGDSAYCNICQKKYSRKGRTTTSLKNHLKSMHQAQYAVFLNSDNQNKFQTKHEDPEEDVALLQNMKIELPFDEVDQTENHWDIDNLRPQSIDNLIGEMIALQNLPLDFVEGIGFRRLMQAIVPEYNNKGSKYFTELIYKELYGKVTFKVKQILENFDHMAFTCNIWTDPNSKLSLLSLTCHGITQEFVRSSLMLKCETFDKKGLKPQTFEAMLAEWNISKQQVHCMMRGEGSNGEMETKRLSGLNDIDCVVHKLQVAVRTSLQSQTNIRDLVEKCTEIAKHITQAKLDELRLKRFTVLEDCFIGCNYAFYMFDWFIKVKYALTHAGIGHLSYEHWMIIKSCVDLLDPFEQAIQELSSSRALISSVVPIVHTLRMKLDQHLAQPEDRIRQAVSTLKAEISVKFDVEILKNNVFTISTYLDPRYKHKLFTKFEEKEIQNEILKMENDEFISAPASKRMKIKATEGICSPNIKKVLLMILQSSDEENDDEEGSSASILKKELELYRNEKRIKLSESPLVWWSVNRYRFPKLSKIARRYLCPPAACVLSDQLPSSAKYEPPQHNPDVEKAAILLFIKHNLPVINFDY